MIYVPFTDFCNTPPPHFKFHLILSSGGRVVSCERTDGRTDRQTGLKKLMPSVSFAFRKRVKAGKKMRAHEKGNNRNDKSV
jgi:hypothetical protein